MDTALVCVELFLVTVMILVMEITLVLPVVNACRVGVLSMACRAETDW